MELIRYLAGIVVDETNKNDGKYKFVFMDSVIESEKNVLYVSTQDELTDEEIVRRFKGTVGFEKIIRN